ncbi:MAG: single-stranded-DNA-specific exonuclease RecJ [Rhodospirillales bacterium]|nr:single-stranded-DNA-specific exonuclease RecJ [Rhodospirillales bacterium]
MGLPEIVGRMLASRGIDLDRAQGFLNPTLKADLPNPSSLRDLDRAAERLARALVDGEPIAIFGDYDVDGATSAALLARFCASVGRKPRVYIPDRMREGYGPNAPALRALAADGAKIVVTVDCGTLAHAPLAAARDAGLDVIVVDHHIAEPTLPPAFAVINPNRLDESGVHGELAAVGVAFLLAVGVNRWLREAGHFNGGAGPDLMGLLDLVAVGTVSDVVPLRGVNRALVAQGLRVLAQRRNPGLVALADVAKLTGPPDAAAVGFALGPRINAGGRVGQADLGYRLLATDDPAEASAIAQALDRLNGERREIEAKVLAEATAQAEDQAKAATGPGQPLVFVAGRGWHPGVIGIVAARLREKFERPAVVVALAEPGSGDCKGSGRSVPGIDLGAAVIAAHQAGLLVNGGGHAMAAGLSVAADKVEALGAYLAERISAASVLQGGLPPYLLDGAILPSGATFALAEALGRLGPFGSGNPHPRLALMSARVVEASVVGANHVRCTVTGPGGGRLKAIAFRALGTPLGDAILRPGGAEIHLAGTLRPETWQGRERAEFHIEDAAFAAGPGRSV